MNNLRRTAIALLPAMLTAVLTGCGYQPYRFPQNNFAGRPVPTSQLAHRVLVAISNSGGGNGALEILDAQRDQRNSVYNANSTYGVSGYSSGNGNPVQIFNYPEQLTGYVYDTSGGLARIDYTKENSTGSALPNTVGQLPAASSSIFAPPDGQLIASAEETAGLLTVADLGVASNGLFAIAASGMYRVAENPSHTVVLAFRRNSNTVYRLLKLNQSATNGQQLPPANAIACQPLNNPLYCLVPVDDPGFHRPYDAYFSRDGSQVYILSCGRECGGTAATGDDVPAISFANIASLNINSYPAVPTPSPVVTTTPVPGGATAAISDGSTLYVAGQRLLSDGFFTGTLSVIPLSSKTVTATYGISDGLHTKMLFGDNNTLWIGSSNCASGERFHTNTNYNCLTRFDTLAGQAAIVPAVVPGGSPTVPYLNENLDPYYYGNLTGLCYVEGYSKVYTAYGGQVHAFRTVDGSEINNTQLTVQGVAQDVAYMDATTNEVN